MSDLEYDFVVIGAGIVGSWTAKELKQHGKVLLIEQFREPHTRGSSHGQSRIIRSSYPEPHFAEMMPHAFRMWRQAEAAMNEKLLETTGLLCIAESPNEKIFRDIVNNMKRICPENLVEMSCEDLKSQYPTTLNYDKHCGVLLDKSGGAIFAHKAVGTIQQWFQNLGGLMWDNCKVTDIVPMKDKVKIVTVKGEVFAKTIVVCAGPWTKQLLSNLNNNLPLEPQRVKVHYWREKETGAYSAAAGFPAVMDIKIPHKYAIPSLEYPGLLKFCLHGGIPCNPDERDKAPHDYKMESDLKSYVSEHFPLLEPEPAVVETCMYTCTPDEIFLIDTLPGHKNIVIGTGFSGSGFKTSPVVGRILSELARGMEPFLDISPYRLSRFAAK